ncbi:NAD(P)/FAD-dependent oxidoreductase [Flavisolibacter ginsenosidimutans]|uniref:NAD(P)/FAD-dependent oxidoreductase n=1 Tax=Flavisolibacter ginsenosidimutans TaxID=661481 RepID=A0A5B8UHR8_9BACT|nr:NAD(P)/FAD-dependent oxidoreductase [Flavisolibacter ginsenosidimutans]QEC56201.1 NAD(P)/FAD-dependent oxidoreductase [Flavisolibacter ginsenosidimutans]
MKQRLVVVGGGAAGFFCAVNAARMNPQLQVIVLEKTSKLLSKVKISGGGRCNVTHALFDIVEMSKRYPRGQNFVKKTFHQFFTTDTIKWFEERGVELKAEQDGRMFPVTDSSQTIVDCLMNEANNYGVEIRMNAEVRELKMENGEWRILTASGQQTTANFLCLATGGYPKASMFDWLKNLGHTFSEPVPSLFTFNLPKHPITALMGVSVEKARVKIEGSKLIEEGPVLITHWGLSGPAILRLSAWGARELKEKNYDFKVHMNWLPNSNEQSMREELQRLRKGQATKKILNIQTMLPSRLWQFLLEQSGINNEMRFADLPAKAENALVKNLVDYVAEVKGKTTFKEEFVTAGGIALSEVDANTMMSKKVPNLFFAGEVLDIDGITGGFNFQHAWTSGWIAAKSIVQNCSGR